MKIFFLLIAFWLCAACAGNSAQNNDLSNRETASGGAVASSVNVENTGDAPKNVIANSETAEAQANQPKTVRDFFMLLPKKYFNIESCDFAVDRDCRKAKAEYLKTFGEIDIKNGYLKGGCDGAQGCIEMAIFKRPDGTYLTGIATSFEMMEANYFLDYKNGAWTNVSAQVVPEFSKKNMYQIPRTGTTVGVFAKKIIEKGADYEASEKGAKLYDLEWKDGKFQRKT